MNQPTATEPSNYGRDIPTPKDFPANRHLVRDLFLWSSPAAWFGLALFIILYLC